MEPICDVNSLLSEPIMGGLKLDLVGVGADEALSLDFDPFSASVDDWGLSHPFDSAGGDSGFSSPQDSPRDEWFLDFPDPLADTTSSHARSRLLSLSSLPGGDMLEASSLLTIVPEDIAKLAADPSMEELHLLDLPEIGAGPLVDVTLDASVLAKLDLSAIKLESLDVMAHFDHHSAESLKIEPASPASTSAASATPTAPSSPQQLTLGGINPGLLTQFEDNEDVEIDVVGDGTESLYGDDCLSSAVATPAAPLTRENSTMSTASDFSTASTISSASSISSTSTTATALASVSSMPSTPTATPAPSPANSSNARTGMPQPPALIPLTGIPPLHGVPPLHMHIPGLPGLMHPGAQMGGANGKSRPGPYPKRNSERKRHLHNELERKRREDLNLTFFRLGELLPNLKTGTSQPTQVHILQGAALHIRELKEKQTQLVSTRASLQTENQRLQERLRELQAMCMTN